MNKIALLMTDSYKLSHAGFTPDGLTKIYSNGTCRFSKYFKAKYKCFDDRVLFFGMQYVVKELNTMFKSFFKHDKEKEINKLKSFLTPYIGMTDFSRFEDLHDLGYLPVEIKALPEGSSVNLKIPLFTITNTHPDFHWLPNYLETAISAMLWKPLTVATIGKEFKDLSLSYSKQTCDNDDHVDYQCHDFSERGQSGLENSGINGAAWLVSHKGTDNTPALIACKQYYKDIPIGVGSVPASEHSISSASIINNANKIALSSPHPTQELLDNLLYKGEKQFIYDTLTKYYPEGIVSLVLDTYDYWGALTKILPELKSEIMSRNGKLVIRPDSGNPVRMVCGYDIIDLTDQYATLQDALDYWGVHAEENASTEVIKHNNEYRLINRDSAGTPGFYSKISKYEAEGSISVLWEIFGGIVNSRGFKVLDEHIGLIYGDGITYDRAHEILHRLSNKGFASSNVIFGVGSYTLGMISRDDLGFAIKATSCTIDDKNVPIYKDPKTDANKKSAKGYLFVSKVNGEYVLEDNVSYEKEQSKENELKVIYKDGKFKKKFKMSNLSK